MPVVESMDEINDRIHRWMDVNDIEAGISAALGVGAVSADVVAVEAGRHAADMTAGGSGPDRHPGAHEGVNAQRVVSLTQRRLTDPGAAIAGLPRDSRPQDHPDPWLSSCWPSATTGHVMQSASQTMPGSPNNRCPRCPGR